MSSWGHFGSCETLDQCRLDKTCDLYEQCVLLGEDAACLAQPQASARE
jgi:hypothetical protein